MLKLLVSLLIVCVALAVAQDVPGGYFDADITPENMAPLQQALAAASHYNDPSLAICYLQVKSVQTQVVSGQNYKYTIKGCKLPGGTYFSECSTRNWCCTDQLYDVVVFSQPWTNTLNVTSIQAVPPPK